MLAIDYPTVSSVGSFLRPIFAAFSFLIGGAFLGTYMPIILLMLIVLCIQFVGCAGRLKKISQDLIL